MIMIVERKSDGKRIKDIKEEINARIERKGHRVNPRKTLEFVNKAYYIFLDDVLGIIHYRQYNGRGHIL